MCRGSPSDNDFQRLRSTVTINLQPFGNLTRVPTLPLNSDDYRRFVLNEILERTSAMESKDEQMIVHLVKNKISNSKLNRYAKSRHKTFAPFCKIGRFNIRIVPMK